MQRSDKIHKINEKKNPKKNKFCKNLYKRSFFPKFMLKIFTIMCMFPSFLPVFFSSQKCFFFSFLLGFKPVQPHRTEHRPFVCSALCEQSEGLCLALCGRTDQFNKKKKKNGIKPLESYHWGGFCYRHQRHQSGKSSFCWFSWLERKGVECGEKGNFNQEF